MKVVVKKPKKLKKLELSVFIVLAIAVLMVGFKLLRPTVEYESKSVPIESYKEDEVYRHQANIYVSQLIDPIENPVWEGDDLIHFYGNHASKGTGDFNVDLAKLTIEKVQKPEAVKPTLVYKEQAVKDFTLLYENEDYQFYYIKDEAIRGLYKYNVDGTVYQVSEHMDLDSDLNPYVIVSPFGDKLFYLEEETHRFVTYDFYSNKKKLINIYLNEEELTRLKDIIAFSPQGGYLRYYDPDGLLYIFGSDSGNRYVDGLEGTQATFSYNENYCYYFYEGAMKTAHSGTQLGIIDLSQREIQYDTASGADYATSIFSKESSDSLFYMLGTETKDTSVFTIESLVEYDPETQEKSYSSELKGVKIKLPLTFDYQNDLFIFHDSDDDLVSYNVTTNEVSTLSNLQHFKLAGDRGDYYRLKDGFICIYGNAIYKITNLGKNMIYQFDNEQLSSLSLSPSEKNLAISTQVSEEGHESDADPAGGHLARLIITSKISDDY